MTSNPKLNIGAYLLDKVLVFVEKALGIKRHEHVAVAWSFAYFFCVLSSYYILRPVREQLAVGSGPDTIPLLFLATFIVMLVVTPVFGWIASRFTRRAFLPWVYLFFVSHILIFWFIFSRTLGTEEESIWLGRVFFVWLSIFNLFVVSVFWSFMADIYTREQGRRLFGVITAGGSIGAIIGGIATSWLVVKIGFHNLLPISATLLFLAVLCIGRLRHWVAVEHEENITETFDSETPLGGGPLSGVTHVFDSKYFLAIGITAIIAKLLAAPLYMFTAQLLEQAVVNPDERTRFFSNINIATNTIALIGQMFILRNVVSRFGIGISLSLVPILSIAGFIFLAFDPTLAAIAFMTAAWRGFGFGFSKPTTDMLYSVVTPEEKYKTKNFIDTAVFRFGDVIGTWSVKLIMGLGLSGVSVIMVPFAAVSAVVSLWLGRDYRRQAKQLKESGIA